MWEFENVINVEVQIWKSPEYNPQFVNSLIRQSAN